MYPPGRWNRLNLSCMRKEKEGLVENVSSFIYTNEMMGPKRQRKGQDDFFSFIEKSREQNFESKKTKRPCVFCVFEKKCIQIKGHVIYACVYEGKAMSFQQLHENLLGRNSGLVTRR